MTVAIRLHEAGKTFRLYNSSLDRLKEVITQRPHHQEAAALAPLSLQIGQGEVVGIVGNNGAGKSTLLKLVAGTLTSDTGQVEVHGKIGALLELGSGFHPDLTGRENVHLVGAVSGLSPVKMDRLYPEIVAFSGIGDFIDQPVKYYSSGMFVRLAFAAATCIDPDVLIIDEALSVGDGSFARKSFNRIMELKEKGVTILFCSHALYQVQALCSRVLWLDHGKVRALGGSQEVLASYEAFLGESIDVKAGASMGQPQTQIEAMEGIARLKATKVSVDGQSGGQLLELLSGKSQLAVEVEFESDPEMPAPHIAVVLVGEEGRIVSSVATFIDKHKVGRDEKGRGKEEAQFPSLPLLKGRYSIDVYLMCEKGIHVYDSALRVAELVIQQQCLTQGIVAIPHIWLRNSSE